VSSTHTTPGSVRQGPERALVTGGRVFLRYPTPEDAEPYVELRRASRAEQEPWEASLPEGGDFQPWERAGFDRFYEHANTPTSQRHLICENDTGRIVGQVSIGSVVRSAFRSCYIGYWLGTPFTGRGYMTEAVRLMTRRAFAKAPAGLDLHRCEINIASGNARSVGVARRAGYRLEGFSPAYLHINGRWTDHERWAAVREDWR